MFRGVLLTDAPLQVSQMHPYRTGSIHDQCNVCIVAPTLQATTEEEVAAALQEAVQLNDKTVLIE